MLLPAYSKGTLLTQDGRARIPYMTMGKGKHTIVTIPGAGDGSRTVVQVAAGLAWLYRTRSQHYRQIFLSRREPVPAGFSMAQFADDMVWAIEQLCRGPVILECNSAGGPIGQWMAVKRPDLVLALILSCTLHRSNEHERAIVQNWIEEIHQGKWQKFGWESVVKTFHKTIKRYRPLKPFMGLLSRARNPERLLHILEGLLDFDNSPILPRISCPTLVIGGEDDQILEADLQREMAHLIPSSRLILFPGYGHGNDQENPAYQVEVERFIQQLPDDICSQATT